MTNLSQNDKSNQHLLTWTAHNLVIYERKNKLHVTVIPLHPESPTDNSVYYSVLKQPKRIQEILWVLEKCNNCRPWVFQAI